MTTTTVPQVEFNTFDDEFCADPYPVYARLRETGRVMQNELGIWMLPHYEDATALLRHPNVSADPLKSELFAMLFQTFLGGEEGPGIRLVKNLLLLMDPPDHTRMRALANAAFSRKAVEDWRPEIKRITDELLDALVEKDEVDLMAEFAYPLPVTVIAELLGVPLEDREQFTAWGRELIEMFSFSLEEFTPERTQRGNSAVVKFNDYFEGLSNERRHQPRDDLLTALVEAESEGERLNHEELLATCLILLIAGHETTANLIGNGTVALLRNPEALARLRADPSITSSAIEELLRYDSPVQMTARTTLEPIQIGGVEIPANNRVASMLASSNRDPAHFDRADELVLDRTSAPHVSFGGGIHFCLGAPLARIEARTAIPELLRRVPNLALATDSLDWRKTFPFRGLRSLPVTV
jgi:cytochrome P450